jgi:hypothetical protein
MIHATHVEQVEILPDGGGSSRQAPEAPTGGIALQAPKTFRPGTSRA